MGSLSKTLDSYWPIVLYVAPMDSLKLEDHSRTAEKQQNLFAALADMACLFIEFYWSIGEY
jgi:hypothetical protein